MPDEALGEAVAIKSALADPSLVPGVVDELAPLLRRVVAPNPGMLTGPGTNTYLVGDDVIAVVDPGPKDEGHLKAILSAASAPVRYVLVTHTHPDHAPLAGALAQETGAELLGHSARDGFRPDRTLADGDTVDLGSTRLTALHTPGHQSNHLCFLADPVAAPHDGLPASGPWLLTGDHVMAGSTVVISPPDGDMAAYLASLERVLGLAPPVAAIAPGHGPVITEPAAVVRATIAHRLAREASILEALRRIGPSRTDRIVSVVYTDVDLDRHEVARKSTWAHLRKLAGEGAAVSSDADDPEATWTAT